MVTRGIVPRIDGEGTIGTSEKRWAEAKINNIECKQLDGKDGAGNYLKLPHLTTPERNALSPVGGMLIYNVTTLQVEKYESGVWSGTGGGGGTSNHASLTNLDIAVAGHTGFAPLDTPTLTGVPTAPTAAPATNSDQIASTKFVHDNASASTPLMDGTATPGTAVDYARGDHRHPGDSTKINVVGGATAGNMATLTSGGGVSDSGIANGEVVQSNASHVSGNLVEYTHGGLQKVGDSGITTNRVHTLDQNKSITMPIVNGIAAIGGANTWADGAHVHPTDTTRAPVDSPAFTGVPTAPSPTIGDSSMKIATTAFVAQSVFATSREKLSADRTYFVRTDGNDANDGRENTSERAWATLQHAYVWIKDNIDFGGWGVTIKLGNPGTYSGNLNFENAWTGGGSLLISGATGTPTQSQIEAYVLYHTSSTITSYCTLTGTVTISGVTITSGGYGCNLSFGTKVNFQNIVWGTCTSGHIRGSYGAKISVQYGVHYVTGNTAYHWFVSSGASIQAWGATYNITTAITVTSWAYMEVAGWIQWGSAVFTGIANVTGRRYTILVGGIARGGGTTPANSTQLPGTLAGTGSLVAADGFWGS